MSDDKTQMPIFSGVRKDYDLWTISFLAKAKSRGYEEYLLGKKPAPMVTLDTTGDPNPTNEEKKEILKVQQGWGTL